MARMIERGAAYVQMIVDGLTDDQIVNGIDFFQRITDIVNRWAQQDAANERGATAADDE